MQNIRYQKISNKIINNLIIIQMKKITLLFLLTILFAATYSLYAQKQFSGEITFQIKIEGTDDPNLSANMESMTLTAFILGNKVKVVQSMEDMYAMSMIWDGDKETSLLVMEINGMGKFYKKTTPEETKNKLKLKDFNYNYTNEYKDICGYKCQKVVATITNLEDDSSEETIFYVTKEIGLSKINNNEYPGLEGYPLIVSTPLTQYCDECYTAIEAIKITPKKIKDVDFLLPADAQNIEDNPELKQMLGIE